MEKEKEFSVPKCNIMGVNVAAINMNWLMKFTKKNIHKLAGEYMCVTNVHTVVTSYEDELYRKVQNGAVLAVPDGGPLSVVGRRRGHKKMGRTAGPTYMEEVFRQSAKYGWRHYFYGSTQETLDKMKTEIEVKYPGLNIVGLYSPPYKSKAEEESAKIIDMINDTNPDFVWIGLGAPKQENWMAIHKGKIAGFMVGVGAGFDYFAGNIKRAPMWMQKANLEWLYRLIQEPKRLFRRYFITNSKFIWNAVIRGK